MNNSYFFLQIEKNEKNKLLIENIEKWSREKKTQTYIIGRPLGENKYSYEHSESLILLVPKRKITFIDSSENKDSFVSFVDDLIEDIGSISDKYRYKEFIGRPKTWRENLIEIYPDGLDFSLENWEKET